MTTALVDGDIVAYRCSAATQNEDESIAIWQTSEMMKRILHETNASSYRVFLTGSGNFRYKLYPEYKANRKDMERPRWLEKVREHLVTDWKAEVTDGIEADDAMGIAQVAANGDTCICSIDKDMLMIPGQHYNFVKQIFYSITPRAGLCNFYTQLILGDKTDNILGYDGKMRPKAPKFLEEKIAFLEECETEQEMFEHVRSFYELGDEMMLTMGRCLWIQRKENDEWNFPVEANTQCLDRRETESVHCVGVEGDVPKIPT